ncbi:MAG: hypothetical protein LC778_20820 [Acidobacteria bacterium]|nr:hypothetical protein [Acidobacteriota bacterium]
MKSLKALILFLLFSNLFLTTMNAQTGDFSDAYKKFKAVYEQELNQAGNDQGFGKRRSKVSNSAFTILKNILHQRNSYDKRRLYRRIINNLILT